MNPSYSRSDRVANLIRIEVGNLLIKGCKDPRLYSLTITAVEVTQDLKHAKVYYTVMDETSLAGIKAALEKATGFFRRELADRIKLRQVPELTFIYDSSIKHAEKIYKLLDDINKNRGSDDTGEDSSGNPKQQ